MNNAPFMGAFFLATVDTMIRTLVTLLLITLCYPAQAGVYKRTDAEGNVEYTDIPRTTEEKPVPLPPATTYTPTPVDSGTQANGPAAQAAVNYESVTITQPAEDETVREDAGNLAVLVATTPPLQPGHRFVVLIDGKKMAEGQSSSLQVENVDRGAHSVQVQVVDASDKVIAGSRSVTFHMQRTSTLLQQDSGAASPYEMPEPYRTPPYQLPEPYRKAP